MTSTDPMREGKKEKKELACTEVYVNTIIKRLKEYTKMTKEKLVKLPLKQYREINWGKST